MIPIYNLGTGMSLDDGLGGTSSKALQASMEGEGVEIQEPSFEGSIKQLDPDQKDGFRVFGDSFKKDAPERASGGPWIELPLIAHVMAPGEYSESGNEPVALDRPFTLNISLPDFPALVGSTHMETIKAIAQTMLPLTDMVVAFQADLNNPEEPPNGKYDRRYSAFASVPTFDFYTALCTYGIEVDQDITLTLFADHKPLEEDGDVKKTLKSSPKDMLACGFVLLNENPGACKMDWLNEKKKILENILKHEGIEKKSVILTLRAINPMGFEEHKASMTEMEGTKLEDRKVNTDWPIYALFELKDNKECAGSSVDNFEDEEDAPPPTKKHKHEKSKGESKA